MAAAKAAAAAIAAEKGKPRAGSKAALRRDARGRVAAHKPTAQQREQAATMAGLGLSHENIAVILGISVDTLTRHYEADLARGHAQAVAVVAQGLFAQARGGNLGAQIFWLKARAGWRERVTIDGEVKAKHSGRVEVEHEHRVAADAAVVEAVRAIEAGLAAAVSGDRGGGGGAAGVGEVTSH